jgi:hypothetical protein
MIKDILTASGVQHRQGRFSSPPAGTYAVYFDDVDGEGADLVTPDADGLPCVWAHDGRIEVYEPRPDPEAEAAIEAAIKARGLAWTKFDRVWLQDEQRYQVTYEITYTTKH